MDMVVQNTQTKQSSVLSIQDLHVSYGAIKALKGISFDVFPNEIVSLIGSNGAGKTTTLRAISGLLPFTGQIKFHQTSLSGLKAHQIVGHGVIQSPEGRGVFATMSVLENLEMGAYLHSDKNDLEKGIEHCFQLFPRLKERAKQVAGTLSGGEQQMLAISRALMSKPKVLMLDEPSLGLAPQIVAQIFEIIKKVNQDGVPVLLVEQNARMALKISHRAYVVETGKITLSGRGSDLLNDEAVKKAYLGH